MTQGGVNLDLMEPAFCSGRTDVRDHHRAIPLPKRPRKRSWAWRVIKNYPSRGAGKWMWTGQQHGQWFPCRPSNTAGTRLLQAFVSALPSARDTLPPGCSSPSVLCTNVFFCLFVLLCLVFKSRAPPPSRGILQCCVSGAPELCNTVSPPLQNVGSITARILSLCFTHIY